MCANRLIVAQQAKQARDKYACTSQIMIGKMFCYGNPSMTYPWITFVMWNCFHSGCNEHWVSTKSDKMAHDGNKSACFYDNVTSLSDEGPSLMSTRFIVPVVALVSLNLVVIVGNSLVIAAVFTHRKLRTVTNTFIVSLAVADLMLGAVVLPFSSVNEVLGWWPFGRLWCSAWLAIDVWVCTASILNLCAISLDRYLAISRPFRYPLLMSPTRAKVAVAVVWTLALAICLPPLFGWRDSEVANAALTTAKHSCDAFNLDHTVNANKHITTDSEMDSESLVRSSGYWAELVTDDYVETDSLNDAKHWTTASLQRSNSTRMTSSIPHRLSDRMYNKRGRQFLRNLITTSTAMHMSETSRRRRSGICAEMKGAETTDWNLMSVDATTTIGPYNADSAAPLPVCMLTSEPGYIIYSACGSFWIPMLVMVFFYLKIYRTAVKATTALSSGVLTKKTGRFASNSEMAAVNLRVHRGGGGGAHTPGGYWTSTCKSPSDRTSKYRVDIDDDSDNDDSRKRCGIQTQSTSDIGCFVRASNDRGRSHGPTVSFSAPDVSRDPPATNGSTGCCACMRTSPRVSSSSQRSNRSNTAGVTVAADLSHRLSSPPAETNVDAASRVVVELPDDDGGGGADVPTTAVPGTGIECLVQSTLTPVLDQCSGTVERSRGNVDLVNASQAYTL